MQKHNLTCINRQIFKCSDCREVFSLKKSLISHMDSVHGKIRQYLDYKCPDCEKSFTSYGAMAKHIKMGNQSDHKNIGNDVEKSKIRNQKQIRCWQKKCTLRLVFYPRKRHSFGQILL